MTLERAQATGFYREGGSEAKPEVRISARLCSSWLPKDRQVARPAADFSVNEKDEASLTRECAPVFVNAFILRFAAG